MRPRAMVGIAAVGSAIVACGGSGDAPIVGSAPASSTSQPSSSSPSSSATPSPSSSSPTLPASIATGQCLTDTETYTVVPCIQMHVYQVTAVIQDSREGDNPTRRQVLRQASCNASMTKFSGAPPVGILATPSPAPLVDDPLNADRIVCLMRLRTDADRANLQIDFTLKDALGGSGGFQYAFCVDAVTKNFKLVPCHEPHVGQTVGGFLTGGYADKFPGTAKQQALRDERCPKIAAAYLGTGARPDLQVSGLSTTESAWNQGDRYSVCFVKPTSGTLSKPLQGIGQKPLKTYR